MLLLLQVLNLIINLFIWLVLPPNCPNQFAKDEEMAACISRQFPWISSAPNFTATVLTLTPPTQITNAGQIPGPIRGHGLALALGKRAQLTRTAIAQIGHRLDSVRQPESAIGVGSRQQRG